MTRQAGFTVKEIAIIVAILTGFGAYVLGPSYWLQWKASRLIGAPESKVMESLGQPRVALTAAEVALLTPENHPWDYADKPLPYPVTNKILHYSGGFSGVLVYINSEGNVEHLLATDP